MEQKKFQYGFDIEPYLDKAAEKIKEEYRYYWADKSQFEERFRYAIEEENGEYHYVEYIKLFNGRVRRDVLDLPSEIHPKRRIIETDEDFIGRIASNNASEVFRSNKVVEEYDVPYKKPFPVGGNWLLERYCFRRLESGDYYSYAQAGYGKDAAGREFLIPPDFFEGTFQDFLDKYEKLVPVGTFGLGRDDFEKAEGMSKFLGFED